MYPVPKIILTQCINVVFNTGLVMNTVIIQWLQLAVPITRRCSLFGSFIEG